MATTRQLHINGEVYTTDADPEASLQFVLRDHLDLTGTKYGCGEGQCGACTVLIEGKARRSCVTRLGDVAQKQITTIEGLTRGDRLHPLQHAFLDEGAMQCAYCTSGMIMSAVSLLNAKADLSAAEISRSMEGNVCRCGTYTRIVAANTKGRKSYAGGFIGRCRSCNCECHFRCDRCAAVLDAAGSEWLEGFMKGPSRTMAERFCSWIF